MTSSKQVLLHLGHLGSASANMTYIKHLGHPTSNMDVVDSGLLARRRCWPGESSDDTHELVGDVVIELLGDNDSCIPIGCWCWCWL